MFNLHWNIHSLQPDFEWYSIKTVFIKYTDTKSFTKYWGNSPHKNTQVYSCLGNILAQKIGISKPGARYSVQTSDE